MERGGRRKALIRWLVIIALTVLAFCVAFWLYVDQVGLEGFGD